MKLKDIEEFVPGYRIEDVKEQGYRDKFDDGVLYVMDRLAELPTVEAEPTVQGSFDEITEYIQENVREAKIIKLGVV